ncbi:MAG: cytochrome c [Trueperaceae bacterium]
MPEPTRQYMFSEGQIRAMFNVVTVLMVLTLVALLVLVSARPQGRFGEADTRQFSATIERSSQELSGYRELENGIVQIDIRHAIELVAERGVDSPFTVVAAAQSEGANGEGAEAELPDGSQVYSACAGCHQANGQGAPGAFPPLAGHAADLFLADPEYLAQVVLFGLRGPITVDGAEYDGTMPDWKGLSDSEIAAVLNYVLGSWENAERVDEEQPYDAGAISEQRELDLSPDEVYARRSELELP